MAVLPVFFKLDGRKVIIAGGSEAAAWKAELLASCGARVQVYSKTMSNDFVEKITSKECTGSYVHHHSDWDEASFEGAALAICDARNNEEAAAFFAAGNKVGVPVNVIDKPEFCEFQFGSIVNRSPVIVSISTDGAAPILGQAIRQKIEILLPKSLGQWAKIGGALRSYVAKNLRAGSSRRMFWQRFSQLAFGEAPEPDSSAKLRDIIGKISTDSATEVSGKITFIKVEHQDAELLTIKAARALNSADVVIYDHGISNEILEMARREARHIQATENTNEKLLSYVAPGKHVVRISGSRTDFTLDDSNDLLYLLNGNLSTDIISGAGRYDIQYI